MVTAHPLLRVCRQSQLCKVQLAATTVQRSEGKHHLLPQAMMDNAGSSALCSQRLARMPLAQHCCNWSHSDVLVIQVSCSASFLCQTG